MIPYWRYNSPLKYQRQPNRWSCLPTAFAMCLNMDVEDIINQIGHDGSEVIMPWKPEPLKRRGFHPQELYKICYSCNMAVIPFEIEPVLFDGETCNAIGSDANFINQLLKSNIGVICGVHNITPHAVAWDSKMILDPKNELIYSIDEFTIETLHLLLPFQERNDDAVSKENSELRQTKIST